MENKTFKLEASAMSYEVVFENGMVAVSLFRKLKECRFDQVTRVVQKQTSLGGGDELSFRIFYLEDCKEKSFPWVQAFVTSQITKDCLEHMKLVFPQSTVWTDQREESATDSAGRNVYDMQFLPLGYAGAGLPRGLQLWIYLIGLGILIFPLVYLVKVLVTGGYRVYTNETGIELKKFASKHLTWSEVDRVELTHVNVIDPNNYSKSQVMKFVLIQKSGSKYSFVMRYDHAVPLLKELAAKGLVSQELIAKYS